ncbi:MAG TPA: ABC transporter permease [Bryobacteraceae bacterium]|jgi:predicted permease|nr:ABC transporter permease [Bryobacteraceae bacterium]
MFWRKRKHHDFQAEIQSHLDIESDELTEEGANPGDAKYQARRVFGNVTSSEERFYESSRWLWLEQFVQDLRYGFRMLRRSPAFTLVAVLSLALGIGANTAVFSLVDAVLLKSLPVRAPQELRILTWVHSDKEPDISHSGYNTMDAVSGQFVSGSFSYAAYRQFRDTVPQFSDLVAYAPNQFTVTAGGASEFAEGQFVSGNYFTGLGVLPLIGRPILPEDDAAGRPAVVVLTYRYWEKRFALDPAVVGRAIVVNQRPVTVVGVMQLPFQGLYSWEAVDLFVPINKVAQLRHPWFSLSQPNSWWVQIFGRLRPGVSDQAAAAALKATLGHTIEQFAKNADVPTVLLRPGARGVGLFRESVSGVFAILGAVVGLVLLIACTNLANLLVARSAARGREIAVRLSIGAGVGRLVRQLLTESLLLAGGGGLLGLFLARPLLQVMLRFADRAGELGLDPRIDLRTLAFTAGVSVVSGMLFGLLPAWRATRVNPAPALKGTGTTGTSGSPRLPLSRLLVALQVGMSVLLLAGAGLFVRTLRQLSAVDLGFRAENVLTFKTDPSRNGYEGRVLADLYARLRQNIAAIPGVESVGMSQHGVMQGVESDASVHTPGFRPADRKGNAQLLRCSASFLSTMRIPLLLGRSLTLVDERTSQQVAVVNQTFADRFFPGVNPVGHTFYLGEQPGAEAIQVIGVAKDAHYTDVRSEVKPTVYLPYTDSLTGLHQMTFVVRTVLPPLAIAGAMRRVVAATDPAIPVAEMKTEQEQIAESIATERLFAGFVSAFGCVAALLAAIGLYGVMAYAVARRTVEIGIRLALGARRATVQWMVLRQSLWMVVLGLAIGIPAALVLTRFIQNKLYGIRPTDPASFVVAAILITAVGAAAAWIPARRASRVDPIQALRNE